MNGEQPRRRLVAWAGPEPERYDTAAVTFGGDWLIAHGTSSSLGWALRYRLRTGPAWVTKRLDVDIDTVEGHESLTLSRDKCGWSALRSARSTDGSARDWEAELPDLGDALDCDLALCPLTNTMPVLRAGLIEAAQRGDEQATSFRMAWVSVPALEVYVSDQEYSASAPVDDHGAVVRFSSGDFLTYIEVDSDGLVVNYPGLGRRIGG